MATLSVWTLFYNCSELAQFLKSNSTVCDGTLHTDRKNVTPFVKDKRLKNALHYDQYSGGVRVNIWQNKELL
jgi:hypothetical protein